MYNLLVVDDERYIVQGIARTIEWQDIGVDHVFEACNTAEAMAHIQASSIDVMICDIEMPGSNGLSLLEWTRENCPDMETIFLTGHANFDYAKKALQLGSFDYILKPVAHDHLKQVVEKALNRVGQKREREKFYETYKAYTRLWETQKPILIERFWQDILSDRLFLSSRRLESALHVYEIPMKSSSLVLPVLMNVEQWKEPMDTRDEEMMGFAVRNIAGETILQNHDGIVIQDHEGNNFALLYGDPDSVFDIDGLRQKCKEFIAACSQYLLCSISCYIGEPVSIKQLVHECESLLEIERANIRQSGSIIRKCEFEFVPAETKSLLALHEWEVLLDAGKLDELSLRTEECISRLAQIQTGNEVIQEVFYGVVYLVYHTVHKKDVLIRQIQRLKELCDDSAIPRSLEQLKTWMLEVFSVCTGFLDRNGCYKSAVIDNVIQYMEAHYNRDITREELAHFIHLNPVYLSRLFKKEMGISITEYLMNIRISRAKKLLEETNDKISSIAETVGYYHFSHFAKVFRKIVGMLPQDYRRMFQTITD